EDRNLDVALLGGVDQHLAVRRLDLAPVEDQRDPAPGILQAATPEMTGPAPPAREAEEDAFITASNSGRNLRTIAPTGIAIESPRTQRQWPMMFSWTEATMSRSMGVPSPRT